MVSFTAPDGARAERVKETAAHRRMRRARSEARIMHAATGAGLFGAAGASRFLRSFQRASIASADAETQCGANRFATVEVATQCDVGVGTVDAEAQCETHGESSSCATSIATKTTTSSAVRWRSSPRWWERSSSTASWVGSKGRSTTVANDGVCSSPEKRRWYRLPRRTWSECHRASLGTLSQTSWRSWTMELCSGSSHSWTPLAS